MKKIKLIQIGFGPIGQQIVKFAMEREAVEVLAVVDIDKDKQGKDISEFLETKKSGITITGDLEKTITQLDFDIASISTVSSFEKVAPTVKLCLLQGKNVISTCEEMLYPFINHRELTLELDEIAKNNKVTALGTGVNPGFLMDFLPTILSSVSEKVEKVVVKRYQNASRRRLPFQRKIGAGLSVDEFGKLKEKGIIRHVGFKESVYLIDKALGFSIDEYKEQINPVIAEDEISSSFITVKRGDVKGVFQIASGFKRGKEVIRLELQAFLGNPQEEDTVELSGTPEIKSTIRGGVNGDIATAAVVINSLPGVISAPPGLKTVIDIPPAHYWRQYV